MRVAVLGRTRALLDTAKLLYDNGFSIPIIITSKAADYYDCNEDEYRDFADEIKASFLCTPSINDPAVVEVIREERCDVAVSINWVNIIGSAVIDEFKFGILNAHAGDLPKYRGNAPVNWAILAGEEKVALSIHDMKAGELDTGDVYAKFWFDLSNGRDFSDFDHWFVKMVPQGFLGVLNSINSGTMEKSPQSSYSGPIIRCFPRRPEDSQVDWKQSAEKVELLVRASTRPLSGAFSIYMDFSTKTATVVRVWKAKAIELPYKIEAVPGQIIIEGDEICVACGSGALKLLEYSLDKHPDSDASSVLRKSIRNRML